MPFLPFVGRCIGGVRRIGCKIAEEGLSGFSADVDPLQGAVEKDVCAKAFGALEGSVVPDRGVEIGVVRGVAARAGIGLADAASAVDEDLVEAALAGLVGLLVAEVPLAENARGVACGLERLL